MNIKPVIVFLLGFLLALVRAHAASFFVEKTQFTGASAEDAAGIHELIKTETTHVEGSALASKKTAADFVLNPKLIRLGSAYVVVLEKSEPGGKIVYSSQAKASGIEEMDVVATRLARSVVGEVPVKSDARIGDVTGVETTADARKKESANFWLLGFGPSNLGGVGSQGTSYGLSLGFASDIETRASVRLFWDGSFNGRSAFNDYALGGSYFFSEGKNSPFVEADFGYGVARISPEMKQDGFAFGFGPGIRVFRTSKINLELQARFSFLSNTLNGSTPTAFVIRGTVLYFAR